MAESEDLPPIRALYAKPTPQRLLFPASAAITLAHFEPCL